MRILTNKELTEILNDHQEWLWRKGGSRADLSCADLSDANLRGADLSFADLSCANLRGADLSCANLRGANLSDAGLSRANLRGANLSCADLRGADLRGANLSDAIGDMLKIKSIQIESYAITYTSEILQIGCQRHDIADWWSFSDKEIIKMDGKRALKLWRKFKDHIKATIELSPAEPF
jgi:hypothetical protein